MLELGAGADILRSLGDAYIGVLIVLLILALWLPKRWWQKISLVVVVLGVFTGPALLRGREQDKLIAERKARYEEAKALFDEWCKTAGEKIYRTVEGVEGVFIVTPRTEDINYGDQYKLDDPYGYAGKGENYIRLFVRGRSTRPTKIGEVVEPESIVRYRFAEIANDSGDGLVRYSTPMAKDESERITRNGGGTVPLEKVRIPARTARYGVAWSDISTREDRDHWIAGSSLKIIDLESGEVMAERIGYMFDRGLGGSSGGRSPWGAARSNACPHLDEKNFYFFDRVIQPAGEPRK